MATSSKSKLDYQRAYNARPEETAKRVLNNSARQAAIKAGKVSVGDGKDIAHIKSLENGGGNTPGNTKVQSAAKNRSWRKGQSGYNPDGGSK